MSRRPDLPLALLLAAGLVWPAAAQDDLGGLPPGPGQEEVYYSCNACHSLAIVKQQNLPRHRWDYLMDWMVEQQGMAEPTPEELSLIVDYLTEHYGYEEG